MKHLYCLLIIAFAVSAGAESKCSITRGGAFITSTTLQLSLEITYSDGATTAIKSIPISVNISDHATTVGQHSDVQARMDTQRAVMIARSKSEDWPNQPGWNNLHGLYKRVGWEKHV